MSEYNAERYPLPMECPECGKTMRPVHKHRNPDMPRYYFCTFCDAMISETDVQFSKKPTNADSIRAMTDEELADVLQRAMIPPKGRKCSVMCEWGKCRDCWLDWLKQEWGAE